MYSKEQGRPCPDANELKGLTENAVVYVDDAAWVLDYVAV